MARRRQIPALLELPKSSAEIPGSGRSAGQVTSRKQRSANFAGRLPAVKAELRLSKQRPWIQHLLDETGQILLHSPLWSSPAQPCSCSVFAGHLPTNAPQPSWRTAWSYNPVWICVLPEPHPALPAGPAAGALPASLQHRSRCSRPVSPHSVLLLPLSGRVLSLV